jgi:hypothetical protein
VDDSVDALARAVGYPYERPAGTFVFDAGTGTATPVDPASLDLTGRHCRLAIGSNASPYRLAQKLEGRRGAIPVVPVELRDHDVVYAAMLASYGAVPATLARSPGTTVSVHATLLDDEQLALVDASEGVGRAYRVDEIAAPLVTSPCALPEPVSAYVAIAGPALAGGRPVALTACPATGRSLLALTEREVLTAVAAREGLALEPFVTLVITDGAARRRITARLRAEGIPDA